MVGFVLIIGINVFIANVVGSEIKEAKDTANIRDISDYNEDKAVIDDLIKINEPEVNVEQQSEKPIEKESKVNRKIAVEATYYTAECKGCIGITKSGVDVRDTIYYEGKRIVAVDPEVIPLGTEVIVRTDNGEEFAATAQDIGSAIKGKRIDILVETKAEARRLGRVGAEVDIIN